MAVAKVIESRRYDRFFRGWSPPWHYERAGDTETRLRNAGFCQCEIWEQPEADEFPDEATFKRYLETVTLPRGGNLFCQGRLRSNRSAEPAP